MQTGRLGFVVLLLAGCLALTFCSSKPDASTAPVAGATPAQGSAESGSAPATTPVVQDAAAPSSQPELLPEQATGAVKGVPAPTNTAPIVAVANYFTELPGFDLAALKPRQKEKLLQRVNSELCTCGCKNDTLARCYVNDPRCPVVKGMVQKVYDESKSSK